MNKIYFAIVLHFHQPTGNFPHILERAYQFCYQPFFQLLSLYPHLKLNLHISGCLFDYLEQHQPQLIDLLKQMVKRRQLEMLSGGYYEPILVGIPETDLRGQIKMMSEYIQQRFNFSPRGMWVPERVWQPHLVQPISEAGIHYLVLDDEHFLRSGIKPEDIHGFFLTGKGKGKIAVFPSDKTLRYNIPFKLMPETLDYFQQAAQKQKDLLFTYADDGEKFGEWPGTHKWVFEEGWLRKFFDALTENRSWIKLVHLSSYLQHHQPNAHLTIKQGSYHEMMEWSEGSWLNFLTKYPEANQMHKRMTFVSNKIEEAEKRIPLAQKEKLNLARRHLFMGQCNCAYWHGVFGGLYLYHLRKSVYSHLLEAEKIIDGLLPQKANGLTIQKVDTFAALKPRPLGRGKDAPLSIPSLALGIFGEDTEAKPKYNPEHTPDFRPESRRIDFDLDAKDKVVMENKVFFICIDPQNGGVIRELDYKPLAVNLVNTLSRKEEAYHQKIKESIASHQEKDVVTIHDDFRTVSASLKKELIYDRYSRYCGRSFFVPAQSKLEDFVTAQYQEWGNFSHASYRPQLKQEAVILQRQEQVFKATLNLSKQIQVKSNNEVEILSSIHHIKGGNLAALMGMEFNLTMPDLNAERYDYSVDRNGKKDLNTQGKALSCASFGIIDSEEELSVKLEFSPQAKVVFYFPVKTVSQSERAYELNYQCSCIIVLWDLNLKAKDSLQLGVKLKITSKLHKYTPGVNKLQNLSTPQGCRDKQ